jgi:hypothetical protein
MTRRAIALVCAFSCTGALLYSQAAPSTAAPRRGEDSIFIFQSNFWVNLHHFLRGESRRRSLGSPLELPLSALQAEERRAWDSALNAYSGLANRSLTFDESLVRIDNTLATSSDAITIQAEAIDSKITEALNRAAPIYRAHRWEQDRQENERWIAAHSPLIRQHAVLLKQSIADVFRAVPPAGPVLVDLARDTGPALAYTTDGPAGTAGHTVIAPQQNIDSDVALDTIFHELSHTMDDQITRLVDSEASRQGVMIPSDLWHALTLYTTGVLVKRELRAPSDHTPYLPDESRVTIFARDGWPRLLTAIKNYWQPYLDKSATLQTAMHDLVREVASGMKAPA